MAIVCWPSTSFQGFDYSASAEATLLKDLASHPKSQGAIFKLADLYIARKDWPKAKEYFAAGIKIRPDEFKFTTGLAEVLRVEGNGKEAERLIRDYVSHYPDSSEAYAVKAEELIESDPAKAKSILFEARDKFPKSGGFLFDLGRIFQREGKLAEAEQSFVKAAELLPDSADTQAWTGRFLYKVRANRARALEYYLNAYFLNPHTYESWQKLKLTKK